ncbi:MAG: hypothetical protein K9J37_22030 [Saprospiraceae bacterium]|nr:hypothetical protein [Saprospiraceae bacterium]MCF8252601.1 hypothetical protein [Saprospiraceae bacterium]MCF8314076.1 hypothetical protein [Saprospiraceae bacterium]MCF8442940.1 hypothetical protein [Saprospiraceae bacterium]
MSQSSTPPLPYRQRIGRQIVFLHTGLLVLALVYFFLKGFDMEELTALFAILAPVTALYGGIAFKSLGQAPQANEAAPDEPPHAPTIRWLVWGHFAAIFLLVSLKALAPNVLNFKEMTLLLGVVESYFGAHMGMLLHEIFEK